MFGFLKFLFLCALAIAAGVAAVSVPVAGKTVAAHVQDWVAGLPGEEPGKQAPAVKKAAAKKAPAPAKAGVTARQAPAAAKPRQEETVPSPAERAALENLIGSRTAKPPAPGR